MFSFTAKRTSPKRRLALLAAVAAIGASCLVSASPALAAGDGAWCSTTSGGLAASGGNLNMTAYFSCVGTVDATVNIKRSGAIIYSATYGSNVWGGLWYQGWPVSYSLSIAKTFGALGCVHGAPYQMVVIYTTRHPAFYAPYSAVLTTGAPHAFC